MTNIVTTATAKAIVAFVAAAMVFTMFAAPVKAQTVEELQAQINALMAQIAALSGTPATTAACGPWTRDLSMGSTGADVMALQQKLNENPDTRVAATGAGSMGMETQYYGALTAAAVSKFQMMYMAEILTPNGLVSGTGYFGPSTRAKMNALCADVVEEEEDEDEDTTSAPLQGGEGDVDVTDLLSSAVSIDLGKAEEVLQVEVEAVDSDVSINRVDFNFDARPWLYFKEVNLLVDGKEVATLSGSSDFTEVSGVWRARFSGLDLVVREGETAEVTLELVVLSSMAGTRAAETVNVAMTTSSLRFVDGAGISDTAGIAIDADVTFEDAFADGEIQGTVADSSPESATIVVAESSRTNGVTVAVVDAKAKDADMEVKTVTAQLTVAGTGNTTGNVFYRAYLMNGSTELKRVSVSGATAGPETITFSDVDFDIMRDDTEQLSLVVDFNRGNQMGTTTNATITVGNIVITSENPNFETHTETVAVGETHNLVQDGIVANAKSMTTTSNNNNTTLTVKFDVTAYGADFWISATTSTAITPAFSLPATTTISVAPEIQVSGVSKNGNGNFRIQQGQTREVTATYTFTNNGDQSQFVTGNLATLAYGPAAGTATGSTFTLGSPDFDLPTVQVTQPQ